MAQFDNNSPEVTRFLTLFSELRECTDENVVEIPRDAEHDEGLANLCRNVWLAAWKLQRNEGRRRELFAAPVDPKFLAAWREYETDYEHVLALVFFSALRPHFESSAANDIPKRDVEWDNADIEAREQASAVADAIFFASEQSGQEWRDFPEGFRENIADGVAAWERLEQETNFDLAAVFRRRQLVPFLLVPRHVANKHGDSEKSSFFVNLRQAHDAFVFGAPLAALALMRSILERVLLDFYGAKGNNLKEYIRSVERRLPRGANLAALERLRKRANIVLHLGTDSGEKEEKLRNLTDVQLEKEIVSLLFVLRELIEGSPAR